VNVAGIPYTVATLISKRHIFSPAFQIKQKMAVWSKVYYRKLRRNSPIAQILPTMKEKINKNHL
jgi:hypothetical protein